MPLIISAPSGAGKSTLIKYLLQKRSDLEFSISATTRPPRTNEIDGKDYYFLSLSDFENKIQNNAFLEYERVYENIYYGTLNSEVERIEKKGHQIVFEVDVKGGINLKKTFGDSALSIFIMPPSISALRDRLECRNTDSAKEINERVAKAEFEMQYAHLYDVKIINSDLVQAQQQLLETVEKWINKKEK